MNILSVFIAGVAIGLAVAAPLGPVNLLVIRASLARNWQAGLMVGAGALLADTILAAIAASGVGAVENFVAEYSTSLLCLAGVVLIVIGFHAVRSHITDEKLHGPVGARELKSASLAVVLTVTNPGSFLGFLALFGGLSGVLQLAFSPWRSVAVVMGVFFGGLVWWLAVSTLVAKFKNRVSTKTIDHINHWTGVAIIAFGIVLLMRAAETAL